MDLKTIIFIGRSGCGKGTQVTKIADFLKENDTKNFFHLEAGDRFRYFIKQPYYSSQLSKEIAETGGLQPEFLSVWAWTDKLTRDFKENEHLLIDGTPRRLSEAKILESVFEFFNRSKVDIVYLNVGREWATEKMKNRGRSDDQDIKTILTRLDWFESDVVPIIDYYRAHRSHKFHDINGEQEIDKVHQDILKSLEII